MQKIVLVAGEASGDTLGAGLIYSLKQRYPECEFSGIGGPKMIAAGLVSHFDMERLSVMGFIDPLKRLPELLGIIKQLCARFDSESPDVFIGIDSPDFNIRLEAAAKQRGIYSVHYVSPSVWAWRQGRIKKIKKSVDLMLTLFPFEAEFYHQHSMDVCFVGHPLADDFPMQPNRPEARQALQLKEDIPLCALMPGSRSSEVEHLLPLMLAVAGKLKARFPNVEFVIPAANKARFSQISAQLTDEHKHFIHLISGESHVAMTAANFVIMASGTTTLEAMLLKRPMIITYRWPALTWAILSRLVKVPFVGLPNLLSGKEIAPELLQSNATVDKLYAEALVLMQDENREQDILATFNELHTALKQNASETAAQAIVTGWQGYHD